MQNAKAYSDEEMLQLSGVQHFAFCPRQWALLHIEQIWNDNHLTIEGSILHDNVDNPFLRETNGSDVLSLRGLKIASHRLGLNGIADVVEIYPLSTTSLKDKELLLKSKLFKALPIEYKRGSRKISNCDRLQVTAQAMILEEMLGVRIDTGAIFYWKERHREYFTIEEGLRREVIQTCTSMHDIINSGITPKSKKRPECKSCSIVDICLPSIITKNVNKYLSEILDETST